MSPGSAIAPLRALVSPLFADPARMAAELSALERAVGVELAANCELVLSDDCRTFGVGTVGEGADFAARVEALWREWGGDEAVLARLDALGRWLGGHRRFFKVEWSRRGDDVARALAWYWRRRPLVDEALAFHAGLGVASAALARADELARRLHKRTVHFVAVAASEAGLVHKLYFSQWVTPATHAEVTRALDGALAALGVAPAEVERWRALHARLLPPSLPSERTLFVSLRLDASAHAQVKLDYPEVPLGLVADVPGAAALCAAAGTTTLAFAGVSLGRGAAPRLKLYADARRDAAYSVNAISPLSQSGSSGLPA